MPIDLKWVRNHPEQVQEWQTQRGRAHANSATSTSSSLVDVVLQSDLDARQLLSTVNGQRAQLKRLQQSLRPNTNNKEPQINNTDREQVVKEMKELQEQIRQLDQTWKEADQQVQKLLWQLASPIDTQVTTMTTTMTTTCLPRKQKQQKASTPIFQLSCNRGLDVAQAILQWTRRSFGDRYSVCRLPPSIATNNWDPNMAHALWGCRGEEAHCTICNNNTTHLPSWLGILQQIPPKSMFGDKQLPQYTALLDHDNATDTFEIVAMTAGTMWDSRTVQQQLVQELLELYSSLLLLLLHANDSDDSSSSSSLTTRAVPASQLHDTPHELSRILIVLVTTNTNNNNQQQHHHKHHESILGWVSNFGDAASRAWDISFATGHKKKKEFVHFVHASVIGPETLTTILQSNIRRTIRTTRNNNQTSRDMVALPKCLSPYLIFHDDDDDDGEQDWFWIPLQALTTPPTNSGLAPPKPTTSHKTGITAKFPALLDAVSSSKQDQQQQQVRLEALTSPFDFLFP